MTAKTQFFSFFTFFYSGLSLKMQQELAAFRRKTHSENQQFHLWSFGKGLDMCQLQWSCFAFGHCWARPVDLELGAVSIYRWIASEGLLFCFVLRGYFYRLGLCATGLWPQIGDIAKIEVKYMWSIYIKKWRHGCCRYSLKWDWLTICFVHVRIMHSLFTFA